MVTSFFIKFNFTIAVDFVDCSLSNTSRSQHALFFLQCRAMVLSLTFSEDISQYAFKLPFFVAQSCVFPFDLSSVCSFRSQFETCYLRLFRISNIRPLFIHSVIKNCQILSEDFESHRYFQILSSGNDVLLINHIFKRNISHHRSSK